MQISSSFDESTIKRINIKELAADLSFYKAKSVLGKINENKLNRTKDNYPLEILGCDSIFEFNGKSYGKPSTKKEAYDRWLQMSSGFGYLHTGHTILFCEYSNNEGEIIIRRKIKETISSKIFFSKLMDQEIYNYVESLEPLYCAGGFALEGKAGKFIEKIEGCFSNIMGLSLPWLRKKLLEQGIYA